MARIDGKPGRSPRRRSLVYGAGPSIRGAFFCPSTNKDTTEPQNLALGGNFFLPIPFSWEKPGFDLFIEAIVAFYVVVSQVWGLALPACRLSADSGKLGSWMIRDQGVGPGRSLASNGLLRCVWTGT